MALARGDTPLKGSVLGKRAEHDGSVPPAMLANSHWIPDARPQLPSVRPRSGKYGLVLHHDRKSAPLCPRYRACGTDLSLPYHIGASCRGIHGSRLLGREPEEARDPAHAAQAVPGIQSLAYPVSQLSRGEHVLAGKPVGQFPDPPVPCTGSLAPTGGVPEATDAALVESGNPRLHRPLIYVRKVRGDPCRVALENPQDRHHTIADPDIPLCMHDLRQLPYLLAVFVHGRFDDPTIIKLFFHCLSCDEIFNERHSRRHDSWTIDKAF